MSFFDDLQNETIADRDFLISAPIISRCFQGEFVLDEYVAFLQQAFHHVKHTVPLLMATGSRLPESKEWLRNAVAEYIEEELGHQEWILNDIEACGYDKEQFRSSRPNFSTELMVSYAYDCVARKNPLCFFGMVHVLEGTSVAMADGAADMISQVLNLPEEAFSYLRSHGSLDQEHVKFFAGLMDRIDDPAEQQVIIHSAKVFYRLFGDVLRSVMAEQVAALPISEGVTHAA